MIATSFDALHMLFINSFVLHALTDRLCVTEFVCWQIMTANNTLTRANSVLLCFFSLFFFFERLFLTGV